MFDASFREAAQVDISRLVEGRYGVLVEHPQRLDQFVKLSRLVGI